MVSYLTAMSALALVGGTLACAPEPATAADAPDAHEQPPPEGEREGEGDSSAEEPERDEEGAGEARGEDDPEDDPSKDEDASEDDTSEDGSSEDEDASEGEAKEDEPEKGESNDEPDEPDDPDTPDTPEEPQEPKPAPQLPPGVSHGEVSFINGEVPNVESFLEKMESKVAGCVDDHGGMSAATGRLKMQFLVRVRGRAEGVEVLKREGVSGEAARCVRLAFKEEWVGTPTADPTGVQFHYDLERRIED